MTQSNPKNTLSHQAQYSKRNICSQNQSPAEGAFLCAERGPQGEHPLAGPSAFREPIRLRAARRPGRPWARDVRRARRERPAGEHPLAGLFASWDSEMRERKPAFFRSAPLPDSVICDALKRCFRTIISKLYTVHWRNVGVKECMSRWFGGLCFALAGSDADLPKTVGESVLR